MKKLLPSSPALLLLSTLSASTYAYDSSDVVHAIGNAHIDTAWLWPKSEVKDSVVPDTYTNALTLMKNSSDYRFSASAAQHYKFFRDYSPTQWQELKGRVASGQWEVTGGTVVEADNNMGSGEAHVREFLYGKRFMRENFGIDVRVGFTPDSFGFNWTWPQIMKKSGIDFWFTSKLNWHDTNRTHKGPFIWKGVDGTEIPSYQLAFDYTGNTSLGQLEGALDATAALGLKEALHLYGQGDHGGGPNSGDLDALRAADKSQAYTVRMSKIGDYYFNYLQHHLNALPTINTELYLETHRGVATSQAQTKRNNRNSEARAEEAEKFSSISKWLGGYYPIGEITDIWERVILVNQFHDILPGSSIDRVYKGPDIDGGVDAQYANAINKLKHIIQQANSNIANNMDTTGNGVPVVVSNSLSFGRTDVVETEVAFPAAPPGIKVYDNGQEIPSQSIITGKTAKVVFIANNIPSLGAKVFHIVATPSGNYNTGLSITNNRIENNYYNVSFNNNGNLVSVFDKAANREALRGEGNALHFFVDEPSAWDAWNLGDDVRNDKFITINNVTSTEIVESGPVRATFKVNRSHSGSTFSQYITLYSQVQRVDFRTDVNWNEDRKLLKVAFPMNLSGAQQGSFTQPHFLKWCSPNSGDHWLRVDLGSVQSLKQFKIQHATAAGEPLKFNTRNYQIQVSNDGNNWTRVVNVAGNTRGHTTHDITPASARYVRLYITTPAQDTNTAARIYDFQAINTNGQNVALRKSVSADGECSANEAARFAVDGVQQGPASDTIATYDIGYGAISRPIKRDDKFEQARFEVNGQKWADLSELAANFGVSVLNDGKYGWDAKDNRLRLTLLKSAVGTLGSTNPADDGFHSIKYALYPHASGWQAANTVWKSYEFNYPLLATTAEAHTGNLGKSFSFASVNQEKVNISAIKQAEDDPNAFIIRLHETKGEGPTPVALTFASDIVDAYEMDMIEWNNIGNSNFAGNTINLTMGSFDIRTIRVVLKSAQGAKPAINGNIDVTDLGGTVSSQYNDATGTESHDKLFDDNVSTKFLTFHNSAWVQFAFGNNVRKKLTYYSLSSANDAPERDPRSWTLLASNDGNNWTTLDTRSNEFFPARLLKREFSINSNAAYAMYRLQMTNNSGAILQLADIELIGKADIDLTDSGGLVTSQHNDSPVNEQDKNAFDNNTASKYLTFNPSTWIQFQFPANKAYTATSYSLTSAGDAAERDPLNWNLQASTDGANWKLLDEQRNQDFPARYLRRTFNVNNAAAYSFYRFNVSNNSGAITQIGEIEIGGNATSASTQDLTDAGGIVTAQYIDSPAGEEMGKVFDNLLATKYLTFHPSGWIGIELPAAHVVTRYSIASANDAEERDPAAWVLQGSNNGSSWVNLDTRSNEDFSTRLERREFTFNNNVAYKHYRFNLTNNSGTILQLAEMELFE